MKKMYRVMILTSEGTTKSNGYVPFESSVILPPLPEEAVKNTVNHLKLVAKTNDELQEIYVLVNEDKEIVSYNSYLFELLMPFGM